MNESGKQAVCLRVGLTNYRPKRSGNTLVARVPTPRSLLAKACPVLRLTSMGTILMATPPMVLTYDELPRWGPTNPMHGGFTTCTATYTNGVVIGMANTLWKGHTTL